MILAKNKKLYSLFLVVTILGPFLLQPTKTEAVLGPIPVSDAEVRNKEVGLTVFGHTVKGITYDSVMIMIVKKLLENMSDQVVDWINNGFEGNPAFATDPESFLLDVANNVGGDFIQSIGGSALCSPFKLNVEASLRLYLQKLRRDRDPYNTQCTLTDIVSNVQGFLDGDFSQGGWSGWYSLTQEPTNNPYGALAAAQNELVLRIQGQENIEIARLDWGSGFLSYADCIRKDANGKCVERGPTKTPGVVIESQLQKTLGSEISQLELADEFDEIVSALVGQLVGRVFNATGIINNSNPPWSGGGYGGGGGNPTSACYPDSDTAIVGFPVTWTVATVNLNNPTYSWSGTDGLSGTTATNIFTYMTPGAKTAAVDITSTKTVNGVPQQTTSRIQCNQAVDVSNYGTIGGSCFPDKTSVAVHEYVTWTVIPAGGSGSFKAYTWDGSSPTTQGFFDPSTGNFFPTTDWLPKTTNIPTFKRLYGGSHLGSQSLSVTVIDNDTTTKPGTINCDPVIVY